ncbi:MAG TPA: hypothetical protein VG937_12915 [Polyangiaceae bacterium]|nr:hypothetical protein [Polyangiaceae bacterium]
MTVDHDLIVLSPTSPLTEVYFNGAGWSKADRCPKEGELLFRAPIPAGWIVPNGLPGTPNNGLAVLLADGRTLKQTQPFARCAAGDFATSQFVFPDQDLHGLGTGGCHGGSGLSCIGGTLRLGELRPGQPAPRHALKLNLFGHRALAACTSKADCFRWPATQADSYATSGDLAYGIAGTPPAALRMGALLALPTASAQTLKLRTEPGRRLAETLESFGAYVVDDTAWDVWALVVENGPNGDFCDQFKADWGFALEQASLDSDWSQDIATLFTALAVVDDNAPDSVGGAGERRAALAPPFDDEAP